jgi:hypothetical protein
MEQKHHDIFTKDERGNEVLSICSLEKDCFVCQYIMTLYNFQNWKSQGSISNTDYVYYLRYEFELNGLEDECILGGFEDMLRYTLINVSPANLNFIFNNHFGLQSFYHPTQSEFTHSSLSFDVISSVPYPIDLVKEISVKVREAYITFVCDFSFGSYAYKGEKKLMDKINRTIERSASLLKTDNYSRHQTNVIQRLVTSGITALKFSERGIDNIALNGGIQVRMN